jgi:enamine deaminase RidA (YjgF/YER057c/UK114 family)
MSAQARLAALGIVLGAPVAPVANYVPFVRTGGLLFVSGQIPVREGVVAWRGKLGDGVSLAEGQAAARQCMINLLGQVQAAVGSLDAVSRVVRLGGFVAAAPGFFELAQVMNGASDLAAEVFGEAGRHARSTVGVAVLPGDAAVEVEGVFEVR